MTDENLLDNSPPTEPDLLVTEIPPSRWPTVFGVISIIYAIIGLSCATLQGVWLGVMDFIPEMFRGGVSMPLPLRLAFIGLVIPLLVLGLMLLSGGIGLVRRRRSSVSLLKKWAILRIVMLLVGVVVTILTAPTQIQMQKQVYEFQVRMMEEAKRTPPPPKSDEQIWQGIMLQTGIVMGCLAIYPFVLGMYLSRQKIAAEVAEWR